MSPRIPGAASVELELSWISCTQSDLKNFVNRHVVWKKGEMYIFVLKVRHHPELVDLFPVQMFDERFCCVVDVLACRDRTPHHEEIHTCL